MNAKDYALASAHKFVFKKAFKDAVQHMLDDRTLALFEEKLQAGEVESAIGVIVSDDAFASFRHSIAQAYGKLLDRSAQRALDSLPRKVKKAAKKTAPVGFGEDWIKKRSAALVADVSASQRAVLRELVLDNYQRGLQPKAIVEDIRNVVGLLPRELEAVENRKQLHMEAGMSEDRAEGLAEGYADELLELRADRIAQTETVAAEAQGRREAWQWAKDEGVISQDAVRTWIASDGACDDCASMDGEWAELDGSYPGNVEIPLHPFCLPGDALVSTIGGISAVSERSYDGDLIVITTAGNKRLACTVDHPVLTLRGFVAAQTLQRGDHVVARFGSESTERVTTYGYTKHVESPIEEIAKAFRRASGMPAIPMPMAAPKLDDNAPKLHIDSIRAVRLFVTRMKTACLKHHAELERVLIRVLAALPSAGFEAQFVERNLAPAHSLMSSFSSLFTQRWISSSGASKTRFTHRSWSMPLRKQESSDLRPADREGFAQLVLGDSVNVALDKIVHVDVSHFSGQVFNLQTESAAYVAQGIFNHNCQCIETIVPMAEAMVEEES